MLALAQRLQRGDVGLVGQLAGGPPAARNRRGERGGTDPLGEPLFADIEETHVEAVSCAPLAAALRGMSVRATARLEVFGVTPRAGHRDTRQPKLASAAATDARYAGGVCRASGGGKSEETRSPQVA
jgi:hypothetical protein